MFQFNFSAIRTVNKNMVLVGVAVLAIVITAVLILASSSNSGLFSFLHMTPKVSPQTIGQKSIEYINANILSQGQTATLAGVSEESGVIKIKVKIGADTYESYATKDGKLFFAKGFPLESGAVPASGN